MGSRKGKGVFSKEARITKFSSFLFERSGHLFQNLNERKSF